jgi:hypothetical protein
MLHRLINRNLVKLCSPIEIQDTNSRQRVMAFHKLLYFSPESHRRQDDSARMNLIRRKFVDSAVIDSSRGGVALLPRNQISRPPTDRKVASSVVAESGFQVKNDFLPSLLVPIMQNRMKDPCPMQVAGYIICSNIRWCSAGYDHGQEK